MFWLATLLLCRGPDVSFLCLSVTAHRWKLQELLLISEDCFWFLSVRSECDYRWHWKNWMRWLEKSKLFGYNGRWTFTALSQAWKVLSGTFCLALTGVGFLSATSHQHVVCYSQSATLFCSVLMVINHLVNREFLWNKSTHGYFASCHFGSQFLFDCATFSQIAVFVYANSRKIISRWMMLKHFLFCSQPTLISQRKPKLSIIEAIFDQEYIMLQYIDWWSRNFYA